jgi:hypothetical protein
MSGTSLGSRIRGGEASPQRDAYDRSAPGPKPETEYQLEHEKAKVREARDEIAKELDKERKERIELEESLEILKDETMKKELSEAKSL